MRYSCQILNKLEFSRRSSEKWSNSKFHENPSSGSWVVSMRTNRRTDTREDRRTWRN